MNQHPTTTTTALPRRQLWSESQAHCDAIEGGFIQGALALSYSMPNGLSADPSPTRTRQSSSLALVPSVGGAWAVCTPDAHAWALRFVQAVIEVISSDRPLTQLLRWTDESVYAEIAQRKRHAMLRRGASGARGGRPVPMRQQVASLHVSQPSDLVAEVTARVMTAHRSRALAARLDYERARWTCTALEFG